MLWLIIGDHKNLKIFLMSYYISSEIFIFFGLLSQKFISKEISLGMTHTEQH